MGFYSLKKLIENVYQVVGEIKDEHEAQREKGKKLLAMELKK